ncbi:TPA: hypothetical protein EYH33_00220 [Candidatus Bipolaricaulota bacterium]|nr:hypothetical protein [Candidatus Bipolaricaulota bacterium]
MERRIALAAGAILGIFFLGWGSGSLEMELELLPSPALDTSITFRGEAAGLSLTSTSVVHWGTWVWQEFAVAGDISFLNVRASLLFGPSTIDFLYDEVILEWTLAGLWFSFHAAQLSGAVLGGPASGAALKVRATFGEVGLEGVTEFGATVEGIEIFHTASGLSRRYTTDPRSPGNGFTAQRLSLSGLPLPCPGCPEVALELYITKASGFEYVEVSVDDYPVWCCPEILVDGTVKVGLQTKSVTITPAVEVSPACLLPYFELRWEENALTGVDLAALELVCVLGDTVFRSVTVLKRCCWAFSTPEHGSRVVRCFEADAEGIEYYPQYWELVSLELTGPGCCGGSWRAVFNSYFGEGGSLFGWDMGYLEIAVPISPGISIAGVMVAKPSGIEAISVRIGVSW